MAGMGLTGVNNPIYQASEGFAQQAAQMDQAKQMALVQNAIQSETKKTAAALDMWSKLATESKDPAIQKMALEKLGGYLGADYSGVGSRLDVAVSQLKDIRKAVTDGGYSPEIIQQLIDNHKAEFGNQYIDSSLQKQVDQSMQTANLQKGQSIGRQMAATPELQAQPNETPDQTMGRQEAYDYAQNQRISALNEGGKVGQNLAEKINAQEIKPDATQWTPFINKKGDTVMVNLKDDASVKRIETEKLKPVSQAVAEIKIPPFQQATGLPPGYTFNKKEGKFYGPDGKPADTNNLLQIALGYAQGKSEAHQRGGAQAANINSANDLYQSNLKEVITLRNKIAEKGLLPETRFKDLNAINQWLGVRSSDRDVSVLKGKIKLMADNLQKTIGGGQGGEWAFKVADTLLDPTLSKEAFAARMMSHGKDLSTLAKSRRNFGKNSVTESAPENTVKTADDFLTTWGNK